MRSYQVGGSVRDRLLGLPAKDRDWVVVGATPEQLIARGYTPVGRDFPVFLHPQSREEYALARGPDGQPHPDTTLEEDLGRRDLTINAMALDEDGRLIDPYGGARDLQQKRLRHIGPAFAHDPLRVLRVARFAAQLPDFQVAAETLDLLRALAPQLGQLPQERIWGELDKALAAAAPRRFIEVLRDANCLASLLPELEHLFGVPQPATHHPEIDSGVHSLMVLDAACRLSPKTTVRLAALLHDLGKGLTPPSAWPRHIGHEAKGVPLVQTACARIGAPNAHTGLSVLVCREHLRAHRALELRPQTLLQLLEAVGAYRHPGRLHDFLLACQADAQGRLGFEHSPYPQADLLLAVYQASHEVSGQQFIAAGEAPGPHIGELIHRERLHLIKQAAAAFRQGQPVPTKPLATPRDATE